MELQGRVDGEPFGLGFVYQRDPSEIVMHMGNQRVGVETQRLGQESSL